MPDKRAPLPQEQRTAYRHFVPLETRWADVDVYGHVNNVTYYSYFDTAVNQYLVREGGLDTQRSDAVGLVVETSCRFRRSLAFPDPIEVGLRVVKIGTSSVVYEIGIFRAGEDSARAFGRFVHVYCLRGTTQTTSVPAAQRAAIERLLVSDEQE